MISYGSCQGYFAPSDSQSNTYVADQAQDDSGGVCGLDYYVSNPTNSSSLTITTGTHTNSDAVLRVFALKNITGFDTSSSYTQNTAPPINYTIQPGAITPSQNNDLLFTFLSTADVGATITVNSGYTQNYNDTNSLYNLLITATQVQSTAVSINPTWSVTNSSQYGASTFQIALKTSGTPPSNTCTYSGTGNWNVKGSDNCYETGDIYVQGSCNFIGSGTLGLAGTLSCASVHASPNFELNGKDGSGILYIR